MAQSKLKVSKAKATLRLIILFSCFVDIKITSNIFYLL